MMCLTLREVLDYIENFNPIKIVFNGIEVYNDYDSNKVIEILYDGTQVTGEKWGYQYIISDCDRAGLYLDYIVDNIEISVVQQHHSIVNITGRSISLD